jgi:murein DD-endopeptidase MepM/ murein hydrolase activator NlpD
VNVVAEESIIGSPRRSGPRVGEDWHTLYADNQGVVGGDPNLIFPGEVLAVHGAARSISTVQSQDDVLPAGRITETFNPPTESGVDLAAPQCTPPYAALGGTVRFAGPAGGYGNGTLIRSESDGRRVEFVYGHEWIDGITTGHRVNPVTWLAAHGVHIWKARHGPSS